MHPFSCRPCEFIFTYKGRKLARMNGKAWQNARKRVGLDQVPAHDLKHIFGRRLRSAGVSFEDRQDLLGHKSARITTHYSGAEIYNLIKAANCVCDRAQCGPVVQLISQQYTAGSRENHGKHLCVVK